MKCRIEDYYNYSRTGRAVFLYIETSQGKKEYIVHYTPRGTRTIVQEFIRLPRPYGARFGKTINEFYVCVECNWFYTRRNDTRSLDIYTIQCVKKSSDVWSNVPVEQFVSVYLEENIQHAIDRLIRNIEKVFGTLPGIPDDCCMGKGPAVFLSDKDLSSISYRRPATWQIVDCWRQRSAFCRQCSGHRYVIVYYFDNWRKCRDTPEGPICDQIIPTSTETFTICSDSGEIPVGNIVDILGLR